jgi:hypothetical protein
LTDVAIRVEPAAAAESVRRFSNSEFQTWKQCRRKWDLQWRRQLARPFEAPTGPLALGTKVHIALAHFYSPQGSEDPVAMLRQAYERDLEAFPLEAEQIRKDMDLAVTMVEGYLQWVAEEGSDQWFDVVGEEVPFEVELLPGIHLVGRLDLVIRRKSDGALACLDHKTTASLLKSKRTARSTPPYYAREELWYTVHELRSFHTRLCGQVRDVLEAERALEEGGDPLYYAYPTPGDTCSWKCEYLAVCPLFDDGSNVEGVLETAYVHRDPYDRYFEDREI